MSVPDRTIQTDILIVGSEGAGARAAIEAVGHGLDVIVASKSLVTKSGATLCAQFSVERKSTIALL